jgi:hypothetical protein
MRRRPQWPAIVHGYTQNLTEHFTGFGLTSATLEMLAQRDQSKDAPNERVMEIVGATDA